MSLYHSCFHFMQDKLNHVSKLIWCLQAEVLTLHSSMDSVSFFTVVKVFIIEMVLRCNYWIYYASLCRFLSVKSSFIFSLTSFLIFEPLWLKCWCMWSYYVFKQQHFLHNNQGRHVSFWLHLRDETLQQNEILLSTRRAFSLQKTSRGLVSVFICTQKIEKNRLERH